MKKLKRYRVELFEDVKGFSLLARFYINTDYSVDRLRELYFKETPFVEIMEVANVNPMDLVETTSYDEWKKRQSHKV